MPFSMVYIALDLGNVFPFFLGNDINTHGRKVGAITLSPSSAAPKTLLVVLVLLASLALIGLALMGGLSTRHVSIERINRLSPF